VEDELDIEGSGEGSGADILAVVSAPIDSPSIIEELEVGVVPEKKDFHISLFGELTKDSHPLEEDIESSGDAGSLPPADNTGLFDPVTISPITFNDPSEESAPIADTRLGGFRTYDLLSIYLCFLPIFSESSAHLFTYVCNRGKRKFVCKHIAQKISD
jgi:hypothetical protein